MSSAFMLIIVAAGMLTIIGGISFLSHHHSLSGIKSRTVGDGQHGTARFASKQEIRRTYTHIPFRPALWRQGKMLPSAQGVILGSVGTKGKVRALLDDKDTHTLVIAASGAGKTAFFLYANLEYCCAAGMSFLCTDTKSDLFRNYAGIAQKYYGYHVAVIDLRNPTRSDGYNMLHMVNKHMDAYRDNPANISARARAEKYAKIISKTIISASGEDTSRGQNAFFYDSAEGLLTATILLVAEYLPRGGANQGKEVRHIISVYKLIQELLAPNTTGKENKGDPPPKSQFQVLMDMLPPEHKARWFSGAALGSSTQAMASVLSTALSRLNAFIDSELEQLLCFDTTVDAESFCNKKSAIFIVLPEEDPGKYFLISLFIQQFYREILTVADEQGGKLKNRVMFYCDELGTIPPIESLDLVFSAARSRGLLMVPIIQSLAQFRKNYGPEGSSIIIDCCQNVVAGGFAPTSETADILSKALGSRTILSGSVSRGKDDPSQTLQMMERPLMTPDELRRMAQGHFIVMKTGTHPMRTRLRLFLDWGITFEEPFEISEHAARRVCYADKRMLEQAILASNPHAHTNRRPLKATPLGSRPEVTQTPALEPRNFRRRHSAGITMTE